MRRPAIGALFVAALVATEVVPAAAQKESPPTLLTPAPDERIRQNDPDAGCALNPRMGYGYRLDLDWSDVEGAVGYDVWASKTGAEHPIVNTSVSESRLTKLACASWVLDKNTDNWHWRVRARYADGHEGPWSETVGFHFAPCRFEDGVPCEAAPREGDRGAAAALARATEAASAVAPDGEGFSPPNATVFDHYPRKTIFTWPPEVNATAYEIEVNWWGGDKDGWKDQAAKGFPPHRVTEPRYETLWIGAQPGRWRTRTIGAGGQAGPWTVWRTFDYKR